MQVQPASDREPRANARGFLPLVIFGALTALTALIGTQFEPSGWSRGLAKPDWHPPDWVFAPVWTLLYVAIALAGWLAWRARGIGVAVRIWLTQLVPNGLWSWLYFGLQRPDLALIDITLLLGFILVFIVTTWRTARPASVLFVPYAAWIGFATALNLAIWRMN